MLAADGALWTTEEGSDSDRYAPFCDVDRPCRPAPWQLVCNRLGGLAVRSALHGEVFARPWRTWTEKKD
jgi:hypothetical protein